MFTSARNLSDANVAIYARAAGQNWMFQNSSAWDWFGIDHRRSVETIWSDAEFDFGATKVPAVECLGQAPLPSLTILKTNIDADCRTLSVQIDQKSAAPANNQIEALIEVYGPESGVIRRHSCTLAAPNQGVYYCNHQFDVSLDGREAILRVQNQADDIASEMKFACASKPRIK